MSSTSEEEKDPQKIVPLDLARNQMTNVRTVEAKAPLVMTSQSLRNMRVLAQSISSSNAGTIGGPTIITTNLVPPAVLKSDSTRTQLASIITSSNTSQSQSANNLSRPTQIALSATPLVAQNSVGTSYHVPRGPAVVANLAAPRSNVTTVRTPMVVTAQTSQTHAFVRPPRTPSPAQNTAWLTNTSNGSQIKGATTVLSSPVRGASVTGKSQIIGRTQPQTVSTIRSGAILQNAITIGQTGQGQIHSFKPGTAGIQAVTIAQVVPARTQAVVYNANTSAQFTPARITVASTVANQRSSQQRQANQVTTARLAVPANVTQAPTRLVPAQATVFTTGSRISTVSASQPTVLGSSQARIITTQPSVTIGRLNVAAATPTAVASNSNILGQTRIPLNLHSLVAVANSSQGRTVQGQVTPKVIAQQTPGTIHLTSLSTPVSKTITNVTTVMRTISVSPAIVTQQRQPATVVPSQAISIAKVYPQSSSDNQLGTTTGPPTNVFIHTPIPATAAAVARRSSSSPNIAGGGASVSSIGQQQSNNSGTISLAAASTVVTASYTLGSGTYFYENTPTAATVVTATVPAAGFSTHQLNRAAGNFSNQQTNAVTAASFSSAINQHQQSQQQQTQIRPIAATVHGIVTNQQMRYNPVMVVEQAASQQNRIAQQQYSMETSSSHHQQQSQDLIQQQTSHLVTVQHQQPKITSSPRPSILRKRDHEGSPLKASKNLTPILSTMAAATAAAQQHQQHLQHSLHNQQHQPQQTSVSPPPRPNSEGNEHSSGSTTISATSSPGIAEVNEDSNPCSIPMISIKEEEESNSKPLLMEMSPRKKPRKQQLTGNDIMDEHNDDMQFISETAAGSNSIKKDNNNMNSMNMTNNNMNNNNNGSSSNNSNNNNNNDSDGDHHEQSDEPRDGAPGEAGQIATVRKPASASLLNSYKQNWKATHNHYLRHSDVRPKDERRPTIMDLANQYRVQDKVNGWKIHHLTTQMEDLAEQEEAVYLQLTELLKCTESVEGSKPYERDVNRINELIKGNLQRIKIINDGMLEAKSSLMKIFDHKVHVTDIINRCASKRNFKKREKS